MKLKINFIGLLMLAIVFSSCQKDITEPDLNIPIPPDLATKATPFWLKGQKALFIQNIPYGGHARQRFDIIMPKSKTPTPVAIYIHGGSFTAGDKSMIYNDSSFVTTVRQLIKNNIAVAAINYRYLTPDDKIGVLQPLNDCKIAVQYIKYFAGYLNIKKNKVGLIGGSAGAGASLWLGLHNDMRDLSSLNPILRQSTRVKAIVSMNPQSGYDFLQWHNVVFTDFKPQGFTFETVKKICSMPSILKFYGISSVDDLYTVPMWTYRYRVNMVNLLTADDPEIFVSNTRNWAHWPFTMNQLLHHPFHVRALMDEAELSGVTGKYYVPSLGIDTRGGESVADFLIRNLK